VDQVVAMVPQEFDNLKPALARPDDEQVA